MELELRADDDNGTSGIVDALAEQILAETALLALEHVGERLERAVARARDGAAAAAVVDERIDGFLQHALLVAHDDVRRAELQEALQTVVAVDDAAVEIVEITRREAAAVELDHRTQIRRNDRHDIEDHPARLVAGLAERLDDFEAADGADLLLRGELAHLLPELLAELVEIELFEQGLDRLGAHADLECIAVLLARLAVRGLVEQLLLDEVAVARIEHDILREIEHAFEIPRRDVEDQAHAARNALEIPDMRDRRSELDMAHALAAHLGARDLDAAAVADDALVADALVLAAVAFPVARRAEDTLTEESVSFRLQRAIVDGLRLLDLAVGPLANLFRRSESDAHRIKFIYIQQRDDTPFLFLTVIVRRFIDRHIADIRDDVICGARVLIVRLRPLVEGVSRLRRRRGRTFLRRVDARDIEVEVLGTCVDIVIIVIILDGDFLRIAIEHFDVETDGLELLDENLERFRHARLGDVLSLDDGLVRLHAADDIVGLDRHHFLQRIGSAVGLECPDLHLAEALAAELGFAAERLLRDEGVRARGTRVDLISYEVMQLEEVSAANRDAILERLARAAVVEDCLAVGRQARRLDRAEHIRVARAVEDRRRDVETGDVRFRHAELVEIIAGCAQTRFDGRIAVLDLLADDLDGHAEMRLEDLTDVHAARDAERVQHDIDRRAVRQERHILLAHDARDDTLVTVTACHLITDGDLALLRDVDAHETVDARRQLIVVLSAEDLHIDDLALLAVRHAQRGVAHLARLLAEDSAQQTLLSRELRLAFRRDLADEDIAWAHISADGDDALLVEILERILCNVRDVARDFLRAELRIARVALVLLDVDGGIEVALDEVLREQNGILVVVALPWHIGNDDVIAERELTVIRCRTVSDGLLFLDDIAFVDDWHLIDTRTLVRAQELLHLVVVEVAFLRANVDIVRRYRLDGTRMLREDHDAGVTGCLILHARADERRLRP